MISSKGGKPCKNCKALLIPPKWDDWMVAALIFLPIPFVDLIPLDPLQKLVLITVYMLSTVYISSAVVPFKIKTKANS